MKTRLSNLSLLIRAGMSRSKKLIYSFTPHCCETTDLLGKPFEEVHLWLDKFAGKPSHECATGSCFNAWQALSRCANCGVTRQLQQRGYTSLPI